MASSPLPDRCFCDSYHDVSSQLSGQQHGKDKKLDFDPCTVSYFNNGEYLLVGGSDRKVTLMTKEGVKIMEICTRDDWVWAAKARPKQNYVAVAGNDGSVTLYQLIFSTVHGLYQARMPGRRLHDLAASCLPCCCVLLGAIVVVVCTGLTVRCPTCHLGCGNSTGPVRLP